jgi:hypothetical protein
MKVENLQRGNEIRRYIGVSKERLDTISSMKNEMDINSIVRSYLEVEEINVTIDPVDIEIFRTALTLYESRLNERIKLLEKEFESL